MTLATKTVGYHAASVGAGALAMLAVMSSKQIDVYALFDQLNTTIAAIIKLAGMLGSAAALIGAAYRTINMQQVHVDALVGPPNAVAIIPKDDVQPFGTGAMSNGVKGTVVAVGKTATIALLMALLLAPSDAFAQQKTVSPLVPANNLFANSCDPQTIFRGITPGNFLLRFKSCTDDDLKGALDDAGSAPVDNAALACLNPLKTIKDGFNAGGLLTGFQKFRRAEQQGLVSNCLNYVNSTIGLIK